MTGSPSIDLAQPSQPRGAQEPREVPQCSVCGKPFPPKAKRGGRPKKYCSDACCRLAWERVHPGLRAVPPEARQRTLPLDPEPQPVPPVVDQRVPRQERPRLCRMSRLILLRLERGEALASELQAMFPGARSVRTRISNVNRWLQDRGGRVKSAPMRGVVGEWRYWVEESRD